MAITLSDIFSQAQGVFLNNSSVYTDSKLLPHVIKAYDDVKLELTARSAPVHEEISAAISVAAGEYTELTSPSDLIIPINLEERGVGETSYSPMIERNWEPSIATSEKLLYWTWREGKIKFRGATTTREVRVYYLKSFPDPVDGSSILTLESYFKTYLAARTAATAAGYIGQDWERATAAQEDANKALGLALGIVTKRRQAMPVRQRSFGYARRIGNLGRIS